MIKILDAVLDAVNDLSYRGKHEKAKWYDKSVKGRTIKEWAHPIACWIFAILWIVTYYVVGE